MPDNLAHWSDTLNSTRSMDPTQNRRFGFVRPVDMSDGSCTCIELRPALSTDALNAKHERPLSPPGCAVNSITVDRAVLRSAPEPHLRRGDPLVQHNARSLRAGQCAAGVEVSTAHDTDDQAGRCRVHDAAGWTVEALLAARCLTLLRPPSTGRRAVNWPGLR